MTTLDNRPNTALLVVDVQNCVVEGAHERDVVVANISDLVEKARRDRVPVVWVQHPSEQIVRGSDGWRIVPELAVSDAEPLVEKRYGDSFEETTLDQVSCERRADQGDDQHHLDGGPLVEIPGERVDAGGLHRTFARVHAQIDALRPA